jgi:hypothetical protein
MATHNVEDGTGGLDASIRFQEEQSRPEVCCMQFWTHPSWNETFQNAGTGFFNTLAIFVSFTTRHLSLSDLIAIGAVTAIENWLARI